MLTVGAGWACLVIFSLVCHFSLLPSSLWRDDAMVLDRLPVLGRPTKFGL